MKLLLDSGVKALVYSGDKDFICNWEGGYNWVTQLQWSGQEEFNKLDLADAY